MWRMNYSIVTNIPLMLKLVEKMHRMISEQNQYSEQEKYDYVRYIVDLMKKSGHIKTDCFGIENLPKESGYILFPNHQGKYDAYGIVSVHERPISIVMDKEMSYFAFVNEIVEMLQGKRMDLNNNRQALTIINQVAEEVARGRRYVIFPEGAYSNNKYHQLWDFKPGCFKAATKAGVPIVPVALVDSYKAYNSWQLTPVKTQVHFLKPLYQDEYKNMNSCQIAQVVKNRIQDKLTELKCK